MVRPVLIVVMACLATAVAHAQDLGDDLVLPVPDLLIAQAQKPKEPQPEPKAVDPKLAPKYPPKQAMPKDDKKTAPKDQAVKDQLPKDLPANQPQQQQGNQTPGRTDFASLPTSRTPEMLGDVAFFGILDSFPNQAVTGVRNFKVADNASPMPLDRFFFTFKYYDNINDGVDRPRKPVLTNVGAYQEVFGIEKTILNGDASISFILPLNTFTADRVRSPYSIESTAIGDLSVVLKMILCGNRCTGDVLSAGLAITFPTGPHQYDAIAISPQHKAVYQPFIAYIWNMGDWYIHGFTELDIPTNYNDVTVLFNDIGVGYYLYRNPHAINLVAVVPTLELHVFTPLSHQGAEWFLTDPAATPDVVNMTFGVNAKYRNGRSLGAGLCVPLTGPHTFDWEVTAQYRWHF